ncbi:hypothetical protein ES708_10845 [subsurface metagenome]
MLHNIKIAVKGSAIYSIGNMSLKLMGLILFPLFVQKLSLSEYGILGMLEVTVQILVSTFGLGIWYAFERWYWDKDYFNKQKSMYFTVLAFSFIIALFLFFSVSGASIPLSELLFDSSSYSYVLVLMSVIAGLELMAQNSAMLLRLKIKPFIFTFSFTSKLIITLAFTLYFLIVKGKKIDGIYEAQLIGEIFYFLILMLSCIKDIQFKFEFGILKDMVVYRLPLVFSSVFIVMLSFTDRYALKFLSNLSDVGIYSLGYKIANTIKVILISSTWFAVSPMIYKMMDKPENKRFYSKIMTYFTFGVIIFIIGLSIYGKEIIYLFASKPEYRLAYKIVPVISFAILFGMLKDVAFIGLNITRKTKIMASLIIIIAILNLGLNILFIPYFQSIGAAMATLISQIIFFLLVLKYSQKKYYIPYEFKKVGVMIVLGLVLVVIGNLFNHIYLPLRMVLKLVIIVSFPIILYFFNFYEEIELNRIKGAWDKWKNPLNWRNNVKNLKS